MKKKNTIICSEDKEKGGANHVLVELNQRSKTVKLIILIFLIIKKIINFIAIFQVTTIIKAIKNMKYKKIYSFLKRLFYYLKLKYNNYYFDHSHIKNMNIFVHYNSLSFKTT